MADAVSDGGLTEVAELFLRLGLIGFGGPAAHIALMEEEVVRRRGWISREEFLDLVGAVNLLPGPNSTELAIHIGGRRAGPWGQVVAGLCFILPAALIVLACAWAYQRWGRVPLVQAVWHGVKPPVLAVVAVALWGLGRTALRTPLLVAVGVVSAALAAARGHELLVLLGAGAVMLASRAQRPGRLAAAALVPGALAVVDPGGPGLSAIFAFFLKVGSVLYGSGYVLLSFLRSGLVERGHWITEAQLLDAVAIGQVTPGPVFTTATFVGYLLGGVPGGVVATAGIFLPAFVLVGLSGRLIPLIRRSPAARAFLDGVVAGSLGLLAVVTWQLARAAIDGPAAAAALLLALILLRVGVNSAWLILAGAAAGPLLS